MYAAAAFTKKGSRKGLVIDSLTVGLVGVWWYEFCGDIQMTDATLTSVVPTTEQYITHGGMIVLAASDGSLFEVSYTLV